MDLEKILDENRQRLRKLISLRMNPTLQGRVDASDVVQEAFVDAARRFEEYESDQKVSPYVWLRFIACQKLNQIHRKHLDVKARDARRERSMNQKVGPEATSIIMANDLAASGFTPSKIIEQAELKRKLSEALESLDEMDREVIALRNFEQLSNKEAAEILEISEEACYKRFTRALIRIKKSMADGNPES